MHLSHLSVFIIQTLGYRVVQRLVHEVLSFSSPQALQYNYIHIHTLSVKSHASQWPKIDWQLLIRIGTISVCFNSNYEDGSPYSYLKQTF
uniref:Uncharacterized protein n=1 Tax=Anguilla anguilla TaxID=7936 RepID=A0A0E9X1G9_ANGAN